MKIRYTDTALRELDEIFAYLSRINPAAATAMVDRMEKLTGELAEFPYMAQKTDIAGVRRFPLRRFPYLIFYIIDADEVVVLHIRHSARRPPAADEF